jgi:hypothetical protein
LSDPPLSRCRRHERHPSSFLLPDHFARCLDPRSGPTPAHIPTRRAPSRCSSCGQSLPSPMPHTGPPPSGDALGPALATPHRRLASKWKRHRPATVERPSPIFLMGWPDSAQVNSRASLFHMDLIESSLNLLKPPKIHINFVWI